MAASPRLSGTEDARASSIQATGLSENARAVVLRAASTAWDELLRTVTTRYPHDEWGTFARFGWRRSADGLVVTLASVEPPHASDIDRDVSHVRIREPYTLRVALAAEGHPLAVGVVHSHPQGFPTSPSVVDDELDAYLATYLAGFAPGRPYVSVILARDACGTVRGSGRVWMDGEWHIITQFCIALQHVRAENSARPNPARTGIERNGTSKRRQSSHTHRRRVARLSAAFGEEAADRLAQSTVAVLGASGTGSPAIEVFARAHVGHIIVVDPKYFADANLERTHGAEASDVPAVGDAGITKVALARRHILSINPSCRVTAIHGALPQEQVVDALVRADAILGCTDQVHSRAALSDLAIRYLVPVLDVGVGLEGAKGHISGLIVQLTRFLPSDRCIYCRRMIDAGRLTRELMSPAERAQRREAAQAARQRGEDGYAYWRDDPQLNSVGFLTTTAGAWGAGYILGWLTGRFTPPFERLQTNLAMPFLDVTDETMAMLAPRPWCVCQRVTGWADQGAADAFVSVPAHWPDAVLVP